ncbi:MAG: hypothetical protein Q4D77_00260 [Peptostreptococcaceae bacterium]|nr:hypothetical protein [Peptostreptococcaceae bacterium]
MKRVFGMVEVIFDILYLLIAFAIGIYLLANPSGPIVMVAGIMSLVLAAGDSFHLVPRILAILKNDVDRYQKALGAGKLITSITMTIFYLFLYYIGVKIYGIQWIGLWGVLLILTAVRISLCLMPQNRWLDRYPPVDWGIFRNIPFFMIGILVSAFFLINKGSVAGFEWMWLAILLSFAFYLPVVLWVNKNPKIGMLMLPKSCVYLWMLFMCMALL